MHIICPFNLSIFQFVHFFIHRIYAKSCLPYRSCPLLVQCERTQLSVNIFKDSSRSSKSQNCRRFPGALSPERNICQELNQKDRVPLFAEVEKKRRRTNTERRNKRKINAHLKPSTSLETRPDIDAHLMSSE